MNKSIKVILLPEAEKTYLQLKEKAINSKNERMILEAIDTKVEFIKADYHYGNPIAKHLIPEEYKLKYNVTNLFRVELSGFWRMLYTLAEGEKAIEIIAFILDLLDHNDYNKKFGYRKK